MHVKSCFDVHSSINIDKWPQTTQGKRGHPPFTAALWKIFYICAESIINPSGGQSFHINTASSEKTC